MAKNVRLNANQITEKWMRRTEQAIPDVVAGIDRVTESPMEKAAAKEDKMKQNLLKAIDSGKWSSSLRSVSLEDWKTKTKAKVNERMAGGIRQAESKRKEFDNYLVDTINGVLPEIHSMPDMTIEDSFARMKKMVTHMHNNPYKK